VRVVRQLGRSDATRRVRYGFDAENDVCAVGWQSCGINGTRFSVVDRGQEWGVLDTTLLGRVGALSVLAALSVAKCLTNALPAHDVAQRCFSAPDLREPGRMTPVRLAGEVLVIDDTYNANPRSVKEALIAAAELAREGSRRLVLVLGEMRELGTFSRAEHDALGEAAADSGADLLFGLAGDAHWLVEAARAHGLRAEYFADVASALDSVKRAVRDGDVVLVKASRGVRAEGIVRGLIEQRGLAA
jgi:UDP-N-acetylmuramoyl-tripeptide--D-alanyl-D-alanine ligase